MNSYVQALNLATSHDLPTEITHPISGLNEAQVLDVTLQKGFNERQSDKSKVDLFRDTHSIDRMQLVSKDKNGLGRTIFHRQCESHLRRQEALKHDVVRFYGLGNFIG